MQPALATEQGFGPFKIYRIEPPGTGVSLTAINEYGTFCGSYGEPVTGNILPYFGNLGFTDAMERNHTPAHMSGLPPVDMMLSGKEAAALDISNENAIGGWSRSRNGVQAGCYWVPNGSGYFTFVNGDSTQEAVAVTDGRLAVGPGTHWSNGWQPMTWVSGIAFNLMYNWKATVNLPQLPEPHPRDMNFYGLICGSLDTNAGERAYLRAGETVNKLPIPDGWRSSAQGMNDAGSVVGHLWKANGAMQPAFWHTRWSLFTYLSLGMSRGSLRAVNIHSHAVGWEEDSMGKRHAILFRPGSQAIDLNRAHQDPDWYLTEAYDINDVGQIVGGGLYRGHPAFFQLDPWYWRVSFRDETTCQLRPPVYDGVRKEWTQEVLVRHNGSAPIRTQVWIDLLGCSAKPAELALTDNSQNPPVRYVYLPVAQAMMPGASYRRTIRFQSNPGMLWTPVIRQGGMWQR